MVSVTGSRSASTDCSRLTSSDSICSPQPTAPNRRDGCKRAPRGRAGRRTSFRLWGRSRTARGKASSYSRAHCRGLGTDWPPCRRAGRRRRHVAPGATVGGVIGNGAPSRNALGCRGVTVHHAWRSSLPSPAAGTGGIVRGASDMHCSSLRARGSMRPRERASGRAVHLRWAPRVTEPPPPSS